MDTRGKSNAEFRSEVSDALARHEASVEQVHAALQAVLTELQVSHHDLPGRRNQSHLPWITADC